MKPTIHLTDTRYGQYLAREYEAKANAQHTPTTPPQRHLLFYGLMMAGLALVLLLGLWAQM